MTNKPSRPYLLMAFLAAWSLLYLRFLLDLAPGRFLAATWLLAFVVLVLYPGHRLARRLLPETDSSLAERAAFLLPLGFAWLAPGALACYLLELPITGGVHLCLWLAAASLFVAPGKAARGQAPPLVDR